MGFADDKAFGEAGESRALLYIDYDTYEAAPRRRFKDWDFFTVKNGKRTYWEAKTDRFTHRSGNIVIEFESSGEPSGIAATKADKWIYLLDGEPTIFIIPTADLKQMIEDNKYHSIRHIAERGKNSAYFFDRTVFEDYEYEVDAKTLPAAKI